jgi:hypothetical protein
MKAIRNALVRSPSPDSTLPNRVVPSSSVRGLPASPFSSRRRKKQARANAHQAPISDFEVYLYTLVSEDLLKSQDITFLREDLHIWNAFYKTFDITRQLENWADDRTRLQAEREYTDPPTDILMEAFELLISIPLLRAFAEANMEKWLIAHIVTARMRVAAVAVIAKTRASNKVICRGNEIMFTPLVRRAIEKR